MISHKFSSITSTLATKKSSVLDSLKAIIGSESSLCSQFLKLWNYKKLHWKPLPKSFVRAWTKYFWPEGYHPEVRITVEKALLLQADLDKKEDSGLPVRNREMNEWATLSKKAHQMMLNLDAE